jgi:sRNA-binding carbon storage regulator CsrA
VNQVLVLSRVSTESIVIEVEVPIQANRSDETRVDKITLTVLDVKGGRVKVGVDAPLHYNIRREPK